MPSLTLFRVRSLVRELRRRRVFRATGVYVVGAFAALQGAEILVPALRLPDWTMTLLVVLAFVGLPIAVGLAWVFDIAPNPKGRGFRLEETSREEWQKQGADRAETGSALAPGPGSEVAVPAAPPGVTAPLTLPASSEPLVAVVPFLDITSDPENEIFADGITEDVIAHLSKIRNLKVISRSSVMPFKKRDRNLREIGARLGANTLLDGSVRRVGDRVRIVAQLIDAETDRHLWVETYDRQLTDIFAIQTDVALHIASALKAELSLEERDRIQKEPTQSLTSYQLYLKGRHWFIRFTPSALQRAIEYFERAASADPGYALPYVGIAMAYAELVEAGALAPDIGRPRALDAANRALRVDPSLGEAHCAAAHLKSLWEFDWAGAEDGFRRAIALCPSGADAYDLFGRMCSAMGRFDEAVELQRRAQELDPLAHRLDVATTLIRAGRYADAEAEAGRAVEFEPDHDRAQATLGWAQIKQGRVQEGLARLERAVALSPHDTQWFAQLGQAKAIAGDFEGAREILDELLSRAQNEFVAPYFLAMVHTGLGEHETALDLLEQAFEARAGSVYGIKGSFLFAPLRGHPRFEALLGRLKLE